VRIAVFGAGGVGGYFGGRLAQAGQDVVFIARGDHLTTLRQHGLAVTSPLGDFQVEHVEATDDPSAVGPADVVMLAVKTWQIGEAAAAIAPLLGPETFVVPLLNGVEATGQLAASLGDGRVFKGMCKIISRIDGPGKIHHVGAEPYLAFGEADGEPSARGTVFRDVLREAGVRADTPPDMDVVLWDKFMFVVSVGGVGAVTRAPIGVIRTEPETRVMLRGAMEEIATVARARSVALPDDVVDKALAFADTLPPQGSASLARDIIEGRPSELDAWTGAVVRLGAESGVPTPMHEFIYTSLLPLERRARGTLTFPE